MVWKGEQTASRMQGHVNGKHTWLSPACALSLRDGVEMQAGVLSWVELWGVEVDAEGHPVSP